METLRLKGNLPISRLEDFKILIKSQFYPIGYVEDQWIWWHYFKQKQGQRVQEYTAEFKKMTVMLGISLKSPNVLLKYLGGLHSHIRNQEMIFKPRTVDETCVQAQYLENLGHKKVHPSDSKKKEP